MSKPQEVQFGNQPPKNADVVFGAVPEADETSVSVAGDSEPHTEPAAGGDESAADATEPASGDEDTSDGENAPENADQA